MSESIDLSTLTHDLPPTIEEIAAAKDARIAALEAQVTAQDLLGRNKLIETEDGERNLDDVLAEAKAYRLAEATAGIRREQAEAARQEQLRHTAYRPDGSVSWAPQQVSQAPVCPSMTEVEKVVGLKAHGWTTEQKARATTTTQAMVDSADTTRIFGRNSSEREATALVKSNPLLYALLRQRALDEKTY